MSKDFTELSSLKSLKRLRLVHGNMQSLNGIEHLKKLDVLELFGLRNLEDINAIKGLKDSLHTELHFQNCPKISGYTVLGSLEELGFLKITKCKDIPSLAFINGMKNLKKLSFVDTTIVDGDLSPCLHLEYVGFNNKKHYSHTFEEINPHLEK